MILSSWGSSPPISLWLYLSAPPRLQKRPLGTQGPLSSAVLAHAACSTWCPHAMCSSGSDSCGTLLSPTQPLGPHPSWGAQVPHTHTCVPGGLSEPGPVCLDAPCGHFFPGVSVTSLGNLPSKRELTPLNLRCPKPVEGLLCSSLTRLRLAQRVQDHFGQHCHTHTSLCPSPLPGAS